MQNIGKSHQAISSIENRIVTCWQNPINIFHVIHQRANPNHSATAIKLVGGHDFMYDFLGRAFRITMVSLARKSWLLQGN